MKKTIALISFTLIAALLFSGPAIAAPVNFLVYGEYKAFWNAGIYDSKDLRSGGFAGDYNISYNFGLGWDAESGTATLELGIGGQRAVTYWDTRLDGQIPGLINLVAYDNSNKFGYDISLNYFGSSVSLNSTIDEKDKSTSLTLYPRLGVTIGELSDLWFTGSFILRQDRNNFDNPGNAIWWQISMADFRPVPIPGAALLLGTGLIALVAIRRKR